MPDLTIVQKIAVFALPLVFAITVHEAAHGYAARSFGDRTAETLGRLTLNPLNHVDPLGTVVIPLLLLVSGSGFIFGWAKPVPVVTRHFRKPARDMAWVAAAGPGANLAMAFAWAVLLRFTAGPLAPLGGIAVGLSLMAEFGILINAVLAVLNMLPIPPLDGGRVAAGLLPPKLAYRYGKLEPYGMFILLGLLVAGVLAPILQPAVSLVVALIAAVTGLS